MTPETLPRTIDLLACNHAGDLALLADDDLNGLHVAFDLAVNLKQASADDFEPLTDNFEIVAYDRLVAGRRGAQGRMSTVRAVGTGRTAFDCLGPDCRATRKHEGLDVSCRRKRRLRQAKVIHSQRRRHKRTVGETPPGV